MNWGLLEWAFMLTALLLSIIVSVTGIMLFLLFAFGIIDLLLAVIGIILFAFGSAGFYGLYLWFTDAV